MFNDGPGLEEMGIDKDREPMPSTSGTQHDTPMDIDTSVRDDAFGSNLDQNIICMWYNNIFSRLNIILNVF